MNQAEHEAALKHARTRQPGETWRDFKARRDWETCALKRQRNTVGLDSAHQTTPSIARLPTGTIAERSAAKAVRGTTCATRS